MNQDDSRVCLYCGAALSPTGQPLAGETPEGAELPDWLLELTEESTAEPIAAPGGAEPAPAAAPDWLSDILAEAPDISEEAAVEPSEEMLAPAELPDWLTGMVTPEPAAAPESPAMAELPDWIAGATAEELTPGTLLNEEAAPWSESSTEGFAEPAAYMPEAGAEMPAWLLANADAPTARESQEQHSLPSWLLANADEPAPFLETGIQELPAWLLQGSEEGAPSPVEAEEVPPVPHLAPESVMPSTPSVSEAAHEAVPDWLAGILPEEEPPYAPTQPAPTAEAVPDWLVGILPEEEPSSAPTQPAPTAEAVPDWLRDIQPPAEVATPTAATPAFAEETEVDRTVEKAETSLFGEAETPEVVSTESPMPDWLKDLTPVEPAQPSAEEELALADEGLARAEVPAWLQELRPPGTSPLPPLPEAATTPAAAPGATGRLVQAEIPDWVQELRPATTAEHAAEKALFPAVTETEGPLAGIAGVLPPGSLVDMPADFAAAPVPMIPEPVMAQAQLWQELLEQPRSIQRPVMQQRAGSGEGEMATRWIVTLILMAVTVAGFLLPGTRMSQALNQPHIGNLYEAMEALQPGDTVVVAVEYGLAEAGEMTPIAKALVEHLQAREAHLVMVSTLPEGIALAQGLLVTPGQAPPSSAQTIYLPGSSSGVAVFLSEGLKEARLLVVVTARTECLRWWVEQNGALHSGVSLPMGIGISASVGPLASPYLATPLVAGWLVGFPDVVAYRELRNSTSAALNRQLDALLLTHWAALALLIFGLLYYLARGKKGAA
ncbi:MAG TPA: hypothetical protein PLQ66_13930 [Anaerolineae bacterium]|nr:hypothetical protein [Anaerolineae bacterium]